MKKMTGLLKAANNIGTIIIIFIFINFGSILFNKFCRTNKNKKENNKDSGINKKKKKNN